MRRDYKFHKRKVSIAAIGEGTEMTVEEPLCMKSRSKNLGLVDDWDKVTCAHCLKRRPR